MDFHGSYKPTGLHRTYPNVLTYEGVFGPSRLSDRVYRFSYLRCNGALYPHVGGSHGLYAWCHAQRQSLQLARHTQQSRESGYPLSPIGYVCGFESPFSMLADKPTAYQREPESTTFIAAIPTVFDATVPLDAKLGEYRLWRDKKTTTGTWVG